jgi:hypothetical protein
MRWGSGGRTLWALAAIILVGTALRWTSAGRIAVWRDEAQFVAIASLPDPSAVIAFLYQHESHPPLYYLMGLSAREIFHTIEATMGVVSLAASVAAIALVYWLAAVSMSRLAALIAAAGTAFSIPLVLFSVQLRPYGLLSVVLLISHGSLWLFWIRRSRAWLVVWAIATIVLIYLHYLSILILAGQALIAVWLQWRGPTLPRPEFRQLTAYTAAVMAVCAPAFWMLAHQAVATAYPAVRPLRLLGPPSLLGRLAISYPFEILLPVLLGLAAVLALVRKRDVRLDDARALLLMPAPIFILFALLATYRSQFLTPHIVLTVAPVGMLLFGATVDAEFAAGRRLWAAFWLELGIGLAALSGLSVMGYTKTTIDLVAGTVAADAKPSDLIVLSPGAVGVSFNRYFGKPNSQVNYPYPGRIQVYPFNADFERVADPLAYQGAIDSINAAHATGRRVWFVADRRWLSDDFTAPRVLSRETFGGLGQADRARANQFYRHLRGRYGNPVLSAQENQEGPGMELLSVWLFAPAQPDAYAGQLRLTSE